MNLLFSRFFFLMALNLISCFYLMKCYEKFKTNFDLALGRDLCFL